MRQTARVALLSIACSVACFAQNNPRPDHSKNTTAAATGSVIGNASCADTNTPARMAAILLVPASGQDTAHRMLAAATDMDGHFAVNNVPEGTYYVSTLLAGYLNPLSASLSNRLAKLSDEERKELESRVTKVTVTAGETASANIRLERAAEIAGTVLYDDGSPAIHLPVQVHLKSSKEESKLVPPNVYTGFSDYAVQALRNTDDHGHFRLLGLAPGEYVVNVQVPIAYSDGTTRSNLIEMMLLAAQNSALNVYYGDAMRASTAKAIKIADGETFDGADITIPLGKLHTIRGHVTLKSTGQPPPGTTLQLLYADTREPARFTIAPSGDFVFAYVPEGSFVLQAGASKNLSFLSDGSDDGAALGKFLSMGSTPIDSLFSNSAEIPLEIHGNLDNVTIALPDPTQPVPAQTPSATPATPQ